MTELEIALLLVYGFAMGVIIGYIFWAPETKFKLAFLDGLSLKVIWGRWVK